MILSKMPLPSRERTLELSAIIEHCPWAKNFLHLGCSDGEICQIASSFIQFDHVIGLDYSPNKIARCLMRKNNHPLQMKIAHFYFHHFGYPFRELSTHSMAFLSTLSLPGSIQHQLCYWLHQSRSISTIASSLALPLNSKHWFVRTIEELDDTAFYIYQRNPHKI